MVFCGLVSDITQYHFCSNLWIDTVTIPCSLEEKGVLGPTLGEGVTQNL
jgi:hypothetical protein